MKNLLAWIWPSVPCVLLSGLVHTSDADIRDIGAVFDSAGIVISVVVWSVPLAVCAYLILGAYLSGGARGYFFTVIPASGAFGALLTFCGSTAVTAGQFIWSIVGSGLIFMATLSIAALPSGILIERRRWAPEGETGHQD